MSEYIITDEQIDALFAWICFLMDDDDYQEHADVYKRLEVPKIVRCRDCESNDAECKPFDVHCQVFKASIGDPDFYCGYGVRA